MSELQTDVVDRTLGMPTQRSLQARASVNFHEWKQFARRNGFCFAETLVLLPDFGLAQNPLRMQNGFFTGSLLVGSEWIGSDEMVIPYGVTLNSDRASVWKCDSLSPGSFHARLNSARSAIADHAGGLLWNFDSGNHFVSLCRDGEETFVVVHGGSAEFKDQSYGMYESAAVWQHSEVTQSGGRSFRFLRGSRARALLDRFVTADAVVRTKHQYIAESLGATAQVCDRMHYGLSDWGLAVGGHLVYPGELFPLLTSKDDPILLCRAKQNPNTEMVLDRVPLPHGLGTEATGSVTIERSGEISIAGVPLGDLQSLREASGHDLWRTRTLCEVFADRSTLQSALSVVVDRELRQVASVSRHGLWTECN